MDPVLKKAKLDNVKRSALETHTTEFSTFEDPDTGVWGMSYKYTPVTSVSSSASMSFIGDSAPSRV